jgi:RNA 3'-terminal phosphate cyclase (ATP)
MLVIDGSHGEGGGQMLRTSLALSMITGRPFRMVNVRARRSKPGLMRQHLTALQAAATVSEADISGAQVGSTELEFRPRSVRGDDYSFSIGTAGSTCLVLQTLLPALVLADAPSTVVLEGGTHNPTCPPFEFLARAYLPLLRRMGASVELTLERPGFYPAGGGRLRATIKPVERLGSFELLERGQLRTQHAHALVSMLPRSVAERELAVVAQRFGWERARLRTGVVTDALGPGNVLLIEFESEHVTEVFAGFGERGVSAEIVAERACAEAAAYVAAGVPVGAHLADQLLLLLALSGGGAFRTLEPTAHTFTQAQVIPLFLPARILTERTRDGSWLVRVAS